MSPVPYLLSIALTVLSFQDSTSVGPSSFSVKYGTTKSGLREMSDFVRPERVSLDGKRYTSVEGVPLRNGT